jgi:hypothetical protein
VLCADPAYVVILQEKKEKKDSLAQPSRFDAMASGLQDGPYLQIGTARGAARSSGPGRGRAVDL